ncbi:MAG: hypothetical protein KJ709_06725, partial [Nanoarchaeota archaeon]|nr:hypothetical protein [Nanoarchaeota archaeon]
MAYIFEHVLPDNGKIVINCYAIDPKNKRDLFVFDETTSTDEKIDLMIMGPLLYGRSFAPWFYSRKTDSAYIIRSLAHELQHRKEHNKGYFRREMALRERIRSKVEAGLWLESVDKIYQIFSNLYCEGIAIFVENWNAKLVNFNLEDISRAQGTLRLMSKLDSRRKAEQMYNRKLSPHIDEGEFYLGYMMCYLIGLSRWKKKGAKPFRKTGDKGLMEAHFKNPHKYRTVNEGGEERQEPLFEEISWNEFRGYLQRMRKVYMQQLSPQVLRETYDELKDIDHHRQFIRRFEKACDDLGFSGELRFFDRDYYREIARATTRYKERKKEKLPVLPGD